MPADDFGQFTVKLASFNDVSTLLNLPEYSPFGKFFDAVVVEVEDATVFCVTFVALGVVGAVVDSFAVDDDFEDPHAASIKLAIATLKNTRRAFMGTTLSVQPAKRMDSRTSSESVCRRIHNDASSSCCCHKG